MKRIYTILTACAVSATITLITACGTKGTSQPSSANTNDSTRQATTSFYTDEAPMPEFKFEHTSHNFGTFSRSETPQVTTSFRFTNVGEKPLIINNVTTSCGCAHADYTRRPVEPGDTGNVTVTYNGVGMHPGHFFKSIHVYANIKYKECQLSIEGTMVE